MRSSADAVLEVRYLSKAEFSRLLEGQVIAMKVMSPLGSEPNSYWQRLHNLGDLGRYAGQRDEYSSVTAFRFGPALNEYRSAGGLDQRYWAAAEAAAIVWQSSAVGTRLRNDIVTLLQEVTELPVEAATVKGRPLFWGLIREISSGTLIHWDDVTREYPPSFLDSAVLGQYAFNFFTDVPRRGGDTLIYRRRDRPEDEVLREDFGYDSALAERLGQPIRIPPQRGSMVIFDPRYLHTVEPSEEGRRITFSFFLGVLKDRIWLWS